MSVAPDTVTVYMRPARIGMSEVNVTESPLPLTVPGSIASIGSLMASSVLATATLIETLSLLIGSLNVTERLFRTFSESS